ncbi:hypothetical protein AVEN_51588-1 [Araneus ventricosus]|uniref:Uncharacterized protein n=1 Tax=Araneus ventricosus TaxID=182803 RepID=A0A4Y2LCF4_ARAVE|nr:hypothetical protein AVEN_51588-1 [Araneus ventricosus]
MINKPRATSDEGNQPQGSNSVQVRWLSSSVLPQRLLHHRCGLAYPAYILSLGLGLGLGLVRNGKGTPIYTWMNSARAELHLLATFVMSDAREICANGTYFLDELSIFMPYCNHGVFINPNTPMDDCKWINPFRCDPFLGCPELEIAVSAGSEI